MQILSGGQTGVDQAAWRAARTLGIRTGGRMPRGYLTEEGPRPEFGARYGALPMESAAPDDRTVANLDEADGTLILADDRPGPGTALTIRTCRQRRRPHRVVDLGRLDDPGEADAAARWIIGARIRVLNVAGDRESTRPGIGTSAERFLLAVFARAAGAGQRPGRSPRVP